MRVYYHPTVGDYATYPSFELDYGLAGAGLGGLVTGVGSYILRKANGRSVLWGLLGAGVGAGIGGALMPKRILSWFNPPPFDAPIVYPRQIPKVVVPSFIGESGQALNLLCHHGSGTLVRDYSGLGNNASLIGGVSWRDGEWGWCLELDGVSGYGRIEHSNTLQPSTYSIELWVKVLSWPAVEGAVFRKGNLPPYNIVIRPNSVGFCYFSGTWRPMLSYSIGLNEWHHVGAERTPTQYILYVDGEVRASGDGTGTPATNTEPVFIGAAPGPSYFANVQTALIRLYSGNKGAAYYRDSFQRTRAIFGV
jgi:hypothetical protein